MFLYKVTWNTVLLLQLYGVCTICIFFILTFLRNFSTTVLYSFWKLVPEDTQFCYNSNMSVYICFNQPTTIKPKTNISWGNLHTQIITWIPNQVIFSFKKQLEILATDSSFFCNLHDLYDLQHTSFSPSVHPPLTAVVHQVLWNKSGRHLLLGMCKGQLGRAGHIVITHLHP